MTTKEYIKAWRENNKQKVFDYNKKYRESHQELIINIRLCSDHKKNREYTNKWNDNNKEKKNAHKIIHSAIKKGKIIRQPCQICKNEKSQAHHTDYTKPLFVIWLCQKHHQRWHILSRMLYQYK